jgi:hypothetical protein
MFIEANYENIHGVDGKQTLAVHAADFSRLRTLSFATDNQAHISQCAANIAANGKFDGIAAVFDLEGFTKFCDDSNSGYINTPKFVDEFVEWLFGTIAKNLKRESVGDKVTLWAEFPIFAKFLGDGALLIWRLPNDEAKRDSVTGNIIYCLDEIRVAYPIFKGNTKVRSSYLPNILRCGAARGEIIPLWKGSDFVSPCINLSARLQCQGRA